MQRSGVPEHFSVAMTFIYELIRGSLDNNILKKYFIIIKELTVMFLFVPMLALSLKCRPGDLLDES